MSKVGFIVFLNNNAIGIYDNEEILNNFINGCYQNMFFNKDDIKIKKYSMNSISCLDCLKEIQNNKEHDKKQKKCSDTNYYMNLLPEQNKTVPKEQRHCKEHDKEHNKEHEKNKKELEESVEYKNLMQLKIDTKHQINQLKKEKQKLEEEKQTYEYDIKMYEKLKI